MQFTKYKSVPRPRQITMPATLNQYANLRTANTCVCAYHCAQLSNITQHRTVLIIFPLNLQTSIIAQMPSTGGQVNHRNNVNSAHKKQQLWKNATTKPWFYSCLSLQSQFLPGQLLHYYNRSTALRILSGITWVSHYQKGKTIWILLKRQWVAVASGGPYANLHLAPDR